MSSLSHLILLSVLLLLLVPQALSQPPPCPCRCFRRANIQDATVQCRNPIFSHCRLGICTRPNNAQSRHCCNPTNNRSPTPSPAITVAPSIPATPSSQPSIRPSPAPVSPPTCPCQCFPRRFSDSAFDQCDLPQFAACTVSFCTRPNGSRSRQCCALRMSPSPSVTPSPSPVPSPPRKPLVCPCVCFNAANVFIAVNQCNRLRFSRCELQDCTLRNGRVSTQCCNPSTAPPSVRPSASPSVVAMPSPPCPCICRTGSARNRVAERECRRNMFSGRCRVQGCRGGFFSGASCCNGNGGGARQSASPQVVGGCPCKCRSGRFAEDSGITECEKRAFSGRCAVKRCLRSFRMVPGFECC